MLCTYGYLYIATGDKYLNEFEQSCASLKKVDPNAQVTLITDKEYKPNFSEVNIILETAYLSKPYLYKINGFALSPYKKTFFLDTDTYFCDECTEVFDLLDYFDLCIVPCNNDNSTILDVDGRPQKGIYPYNTGVVGYNKNERTDRLINNWLQAYIRHFDHYIHDQPPFMEALLSTDIKILTLASIYNARTPYVSAFIGKAVKIIHGRHNDYEKVARKLNAHEDYGRLWMPRFERIYVDRRSAFFRWYMSLGNESKKKIKSLVKPVVDKLGLGNYK